MLNSLAKIKNNNHLLKSTTNIIKNQEGYPIAAFCININIESFQQVNIFLNEFLGSSSIDLSSQKKGKENNISNITKQMVVDIITTVGKEEKLSSKENKLQIIKKLNDQDIFLVKDIVPFVCNLLSISQATLYNYLREIRNDDVFSDFFTR